MNDYPVLRLIVRYGTAGSIALGVVAFASIAYLGYPALSGLAIAFGALVGIVLFIIGKSYAELVRIITEMLLPR
jgi:hypothetical protein